jgi:hypothetical protein
MKAYREWRYSSTIIDLRTGRKWAVSFTPRLFYPRNRSPSIHWINGREGLEPIWALLRKISDPTGNLTGRPIQPGHYTDWANHDPLLDMVRKLIWRTRHTQPRNGITVLKRNCIKHVYLNTWSGCRMRATTYHPTYRPTDVRLNTASTLKYSLENLHRIRVPLQKYPTCNA